MRGAVFLGGEAPQLSRVLESLDRFDMTVAADSGLHIAEAWGYRPDWIVGDMDSIDSEERLSRYPEGRILRYPCDKDETDAQIAVKLLQRFSDDITLIGGSGGRLAHILALMALFDAPIPPKCWLGQEEIINCVDAKLWPRLSLQMPQDTLISIFPVSDSPWRIHSDGLKWKLSNLTWINSQYSLSNRTESEKVLLEVEQGRFLVLRSYTA